MSRRGVLLAVLLALLPSATMAAPRAFLPGEVLVIVAAPDVLAPGPGGRVTAAGASTAEVLAALGIEQGSRLAADRAGGREFWRLRSSKPGFDPIAAARDLRSSGAFVAAVPNYNMRLVDTIPNDPYVSDQWYVDAPNGADVHLPEAWDVTHGAASVVIGIMDTGVDTGHPDLASKIWTNPGEIAANGIDDDGNGWIDDLHGWDFGNSDADPNPHAMFDEIGLDVGFHGTFVAGIAGAATHNGTGIAGAGWNCKILPLKIADASGDMPLSAVTAAFDYMAGVPGAVLNMSFGGRGEGVPEYFQPLVDMVTGAGVLCVAAAGNDSTNVPMYPAASAGVLAVGATDADNQRAFFSNYGSWVDVAAPGAMMWSAICRNYAIDEVSQLFYWLLFGWDMENPYMYGDGTSFASPLVAGVCGLVRARFPWLLPRHVAHHIVNTGDAVAYDQPIGVKLNAYRAVQVPTDAGVLAGMPGTALAVGRNPFHDSTALRFSLAADAEVRLAVYDASGRRVRRVAAERLAAGPHSYEWDGQSEDNRPLPSGVYFAKLETPGSTSVRKLLLIRR